MEDEKKDRGFTVSEIEDKMKKHGVEICLSAMFILAGLFALSWDGSS